MKDDLNRIENKLDKLDERLDNVDKHLSVYNEQLKYHIERTNLLESEVKPIKEHVHTVRNLLWGASLLVSTLVVLYQTGILQKIVRVLTTQ